MSQPAASQPGSRAAAGQATAGRQLASRSTTFQIEMLYFFTLRSVVGVGLYTIKMQSPNPPSQLNLKLKSTPFQFGNGVLQDRQLAASGCLAGCWPGVWLVGWPQSGSSAGGLAVSRENQRGDWLTSICLARRSVLAQLISLIGFGRLLSMHRIAGQTRLHDLAFRFGWRFK